MPVQGVLKAMDGVPHDTPVDLRPYVNSAPIMVSPKCPIERCFTLFRAMGLRHLVVQDNLGAVVGIITRKDLIDTFTHSSAADEVLKLGRRRRGAKNGQGSQYIGDDVSIESLMKGT